jgi:hypothetical protein
MVNGDQPAGKLLFWRVASLVLLVVLVAVAIYSYRITVASDALILGYERDLADAKALLNQQTKIAMQIIDVHEKNLAILKQCGADLSIVEGSSPTASGGTPAASRILEKFTAD